ncbi:MAG: hypothetical protein ACSLFH_16015 [Desulfuromonadales bacterium]
MNKLLRHKLFSRLLILLCLLLYTGTSQAFWCTGAKGSSHLKLNTIGSRVAACLPDTEKHQRNESKVGLEAVLYDIDNDCSHIRAYDSVISSTNKDCFKLKPALKVFIAADFLRGFKQNLPEVYLQSRFRALQLPPLQALTALRTVVLLH